MNTLRNTPNKLPLGRRALATIAGSLLLLSASGCGSDMKTEEITTSIPIVCEDGSNVVIAGPYTPGVDAEKRRIFVSNPEIRPDMVSRDGQRKPDKDDFVFVAGCETGTINAPETISPGEVDAVLTITTKDQFGTVELEKTRGYRSPQDIKVVHGDNDGLAYVVVNDGDKITDATVTVTGQDDFNLVG